MLRRMQELVAKRTLFERKKFAIWGFCNSNSVLDVRFMSGNRMSIDGRDCLLMSERKVSHSSGSEACSLTS